MLSDTTKRTGPTGEGTTEEAELTVQWLHERGYGERNSLCRPRLRIGRGPACHARLEHASVSREHAEIHRQGPIHVLRDLGSTNGTYLNGVRTEHGVVADGDVIRVGNYLALVSKMPRSAEKVSFGELAPGLFGGPTLVLAFATIRRAAVTDIPVVIVGETGAGKERVARAIHHLSGRRGPFHAFNCSALPESLAEAELFGHERGAFSSADRARIGHLRAADGGTLFLDEVADLELSIQAKVLRALEQREVTPLGGTQPIGFDARVVVAAQEPLESYVERKEFRADLFARLAGFQVEVAPLRRRREDIPGLFLHLLEKHARCPLPAIDSKLWERLCLHTWPGNVRELELFTRKLVALRSEEAVLLREFADGILADTKATERAGPNVSGLADRREHDLVRLQAALAEHDNNMTAAAASVGISRRRAYRLLESFKVDPHAELPARAGARNDG